MTTGAVGGLEANISKHCLWLPTCCDGCGHFWWGQCSSSVVFESYSNPVAKEKEATTLTLFCHGGELTDGNHQEHQSKNHLHIDFLVFKFNNLNGAVAHHPRQRWAYYSFQSTKEVILLLIMRTSCSSSSSFSSSRCFFSTISRGTSFLWTRTPLFQTQTARRTTAVESQLRFALPCISDLNKFWTLTCHEKYVFARNKIYSII